MIMHFILLISLIFIEIVIYLFQKNKAIKNVRFAKVFCMGLALFVFAALRDSSVGIDVPGYCKLFYETKRYDVIDIFSWKEGRDPVFTVFVKALSYIYSGHQILLVAVGAIVAFSFSFFVYHQRGNVLMHYILFITFRMFAFTLTGLRQAMALSICWIALVMLQKDRKILFLLLVSIGTMFHLSAIAFFSVLLLKYIKKIDIFTCILIIIAFFDLLSGHSLVTQMTKLLGERFLSYVDQNELVEYSMGGTFYIYMLFFTFLIWGFCIRKVDLVKDENILLLFKVAVIAMILSIMCQNIPSMFRMSYYFMIPFYSLISPTINKVFVKKDALLINGLCVVLLCAQYLILTPGAGINNYKFFWS